MKRLAIISSHPIQYNAPIFSLLAKEPLVELMVFYTWGEAALGSKYDPDFGKEINWDIPLLEGYNYTFIKNISKEPGSHHFKGIINPTLNEEIEAWKPNVVWVWGWSFNSHLKALRYFKGRIPVWFRGDSTLLNEPNRFSVKKVARRLILTYVYHYIDKAFYVGTNNKNYFKVHGVSEDKLVYAPHVIDNIRFSKMTNDDNCEIEKLRVKYGFKNTDIILLFAGKFEKVKNIEFLIQYLKTTQIDNLKLLIVGNGILEKKLKNLSSKLQNIIFIDFQNQSLMPYIYKLANVYVLPSLQDTWGLSINESLACGTPVIVSNMCGGAIDLVDETNGIIINVLKMTESFSAISIFLNNLNSYRRISIQNHYIKSNGIDNLVNIISNELLKS